MNNKKDNKNKGYRLCVLFLLSHHLRKSITYRQKPKGLYLSLSSLITLGKRLSVVSAQGLYNVLAGSYQAQARTALEILPSLEAERVAGLSKHIT